MMTLEVIMGMPIDLYAVRHGESEQNTLITAGLNGDTTLFTEDNVTVPDAAWRLTEDGRKQAYYIGRWLVQQQRVYDAYMVSPYIRCLETASLMGLPKAKWVQKRILRERSWGEICTVTRDEFKTNYPRNWMFRKTDPLYWRPPAGESIADVSENRVHNMLTSLDRNHDGESIIMVTHGDFMYALMLTLEGLSDDDYLKREHDDKWRIGNCTCIHYTRRDPVSGKINKRFCWEQRATPIHNDNGWNVNVTEWREFHRDAFNNGDLMEIVREFDRKFEI